MPLPTFGEVTDFLISNKNVVRETFEFRKSDKYTGERKRKFNPIYRCCQYAFPLLWYNRVSNRGLVGSPAKVWRFVPIPNAQLANSTNARVKKLKPYRLIRIFEFAKPTDIHNRHGRVPRTTGDCHVNPVYSWSRPNIVHLYFKAPCRTRNAKSGLRFGFVLNRIIHGFEHRPHFIRTTPELLVSMARPVQRARSKWSLNVDSGLEAIADIRIIRAARQYCDRRFGSRQTGF